MIVSILLYSTLSFGDIYSTRIGLSHGGIEYNRFMSDNLLLKKSIQTSAMVAIDQSLKRKPGLRKILRIAAISLNGYVIVHNLRVKR